MKTYPKYVAALLVVILTTSCTLPDTEGANPLDRPQDLKGARQLHEENMRKITSNPAYRAASVSVNQ